MNGGIEYERKWVLTAEQFMRIRDMFDYQNDTGKIIEQYYLYADNTSESRVRIMTADDSNKVSCTMTIKLGDDASQRVEHEIKIPENMAKSLIKQCSRKVPILKHRCTWILKDVGEFTTDTYLNVHDLIILEKEFDSQVEMHQFQPPIWFGKEVTGEFGYKNKTIWKVLNDIPTI